MSQRKPTSPKPDSSEKTKKESHKEYATVGICGSTFAAPLFLLLQAPFTLVFVWIIVIYYDASILKFAQEVTWHDILQHFPSPSLEALFIILGWGIMQYLLLVIVPGQEFEGTISPMGEIPKYKLNGVSCYFLTHILLYLVVYRFHLFSPSLIYDRFGEILITVSLVAMFFCFLLYIKAKVSPTSADIVFTGSYLYDFFEGAELYPRLFGVQLKQWVNCRFGMMGWSAIICFFAAKQYEETGDVSNSMLAAVLIQVVYIIKFFWWEGGYFRSIDIMHDRFGFYLCWGCMCWITGVYTLSTLYLVQRPFHMNSIAFVLTVIFGVVSVYINYWADIQRQTVRETNGKCTVWGRPPVLIRATYQTGDGKQHDTILLASGWWGIARHFHYVPEITLSIGWTLPCGFHHALPWFYVTYLTILLTDRARRDDIRCSAKYTTYWKEYCKKVPYKMIPFLY